MKGNSTIKRTLIGLGIILLTVLQPILSALYYESMMFFGILDIIDIGCQIALAVFVFLNLNGLIPMIVIGAWAVIPMLFGSFDLGCISLLATVLVKEFAGKKVPFLKHFFWAPAVLSLVLRIRFFISLFQSFGSNSLYLIALVLIYVVLFLLLGYWFIGQVQTKTEHADGQRDANIAYFKGLLERGVITQEEFDAKVKELNQ